MKIKFLIVILFYSLFTFSQSNYLLSLEQLISLQKKSLTQINDNLISKNWSLYESNPETEGRLASTTWNYGINYDDEAFGWFHLYSSKFSNRITYQFHVKSHYIKLKSSLNLLGFKQVNETVYDDVLSMVYINKNNAIIINITKQSSYRKNEKYEFIVFDILDYNLFISTKLEEDNSNNELNSEELVEEIQSKIEFSDNIISRGLVGTWDLFDIESELPNEITIDEMYLYENIIESYIKNITSAKLILSSLGYYKIKIDNAELNGYWNAIDNEFFMQNNFKTATNNFKIVTNSNNMFFIRHYVNDNYYIKFYFRRN